MNNTQKFTKRQIVAVFALSALFGCSRTADIQTGGNNVVTAGDREIDDAPKDDAPKDETIEAILERLNGWNAEAVKGLYNSPPDSNIVDDGEIGGWVSRHEKEAKAIGYEIYWSREESRFLARRIGTAIGTKDKNP